MTKKAKFFSVFAVLAVLAAVGGALWWGQRDVAPDMTTDVVKRGDVLQSVDLTGRLEKEETRNLAFAASGEVKSVPEVGDVVAKGKVLATVEFMGETVELKSPIDALVTRVDVHVGDLVSAGMPVIGIESSSDTFVVVALAAESDVTKIQAGQSAIMTLDALGGDVEFAGDVVSIAPTATLFEGVPYFAVELSLDGEIDGEKGGTEGLRSGMSVDIAVTTKKTAGALYIPSRAVVSRDDQRYVRIPDELNEAGYVERQVLLGERGDNGLVVVKSGLREGDTIVVSIEERE